jgi:transposase
MEHLAIDLGGKESQICVRAPDGTILDERKHGTALLGSYLEQRPKSRVILEACSEAFAVADLAEKQGHEVRVVPPTLVRAFGVGARGVKNDQRDARALSETSTRLDLPSVHIPSARSRELKALSAMREGLVGARTKLCNLARSWIRTRLVKLKPCKPTTLTRRIRETFATEVPTHVERVLVMIDALNVQVKAADRELATLASEDPICQRLMSVPGVGPVTAVRFIAAIDDIKRFPNAHAVQSYLGLTPGEDSSSTRIRNTGLTKAGSPRTRWALVQAAWCAMRTRPQDPMVQWAREVAKRRGKMVAVVALARKLAGILFAIWRDGSSYIPRRGAKNRARVIGWIAEGKEALRIARKMR